MSLINVGSELISIVGKSAPLLGSLLGSPFAGIAISLLGNAFHVDPSKLDELQAAITGDPNAEDTLKTLEDNHKEAMAKIMATDYSVDAADRKDARTYQDKHFWILSTLSLLFVAFYFIFIIFSQHFGLDPDEAHSTQDNLTNALFLILSYFFGSCHNK